MSEASVLRRLVSPAGELLREWTVSQDEKRWLKSVSRRDRESYEDFHTAFELGEPAKGLLPPLEAIAALRWARLEYGVDWTDEYLSYTVGGD